jgi:hypothetical protein
MSDNRGPLQLEAYTIIHVGNCARSSRKNATTDHDLNSMCSGIHLALCYTPVKPKAYVIAMKMFLVLCKYLARQKTGVPIY